MTRKQAKETAKEGERCQLTNSNADDFVAWVRSHGGKARAANGPTPESPRPVQLFEYGGGVWLDPGDWVILKNGKLSYKAGKLQ